jgi:hypothetical protein
VLFTVVFAAALVLQIWLRPFAFDRLHYMQLAASGCLLVTSFVTLTFFNMDRDRDTSAVYKEVMGGIILAINGIFVVYCIVCIVLLAQGVVRRLLQRLLTAELAWCVRLLPQSLVALLRLPSGYPSSDPSAPFSLFKQTSASSSAAAGDLEADVARRHKAGKSVEHQEQQQQQPFGWHWQQRGPPTESKAGPVPPDAVSSSGRCSASGRESWYSFKASELPDA